MADVLIALMDGLPRSVPATAGGGGPVGDYGPNATIVGEVRGREALRPLAVRRWIQS